MVENEKRIFFDRFCLDLGRECLWKGSRAIKLRPKVFGVLAYLLGRPGQLVTKEDLLEGVWPGTFVGEDVLKGAIRQIREALHDNPKTPRFIETAHRRGYRFIGQIAAGERTPAIARPPLRPTDSLQGVVGREGALSQMRGRLEKAFAG